MTIPQRDGTVKRFPERDLRPAFANALDRSLGRSGPDEPEHPVCVAARNSSDPKWRDSFFVVEWAEPVEDLSE
jgi:hypothetical protein